MDNRLQEIADNPNKFKIGLDDPFRFKCRGCGKCCKNREDIMLTSRDLFKIAAYLKLMTEDVVEQYCDFYVGRDSRIPIVRLQPKGVNRACPFLADKRCRVHEVKPVVCALYPVGRILMAEKEPKEGEEPSYQAGYIILPITCGSLKKTNTVRQWLEKFGIPVDDAFYNEWNKIVMLISRTIHELEQEVSARALVPVESMLFELLYIRYDTQSDFMPQFCKNAAEIERLLEDVKQLAEQAKNESEGGKHE